MASYHGTNIRDRERSLHVMLWQAEARRRDILLILEARFGSNPSRALAEVIEEISNPEELDRWLVAAVTAPSLEAFRAAVQPGYDD